MLKKITIGVAVVIVLLISTFIGWAAYENEQYIASIERQLNVALTEVDMLERELSNTPNVEQLEEELAETKEKLQISNDQLEKIQMRNESQKALELMEGDGE